MDIGLRRIGQIKIDHMAEAGNINATRCHICGDQCLQFSIPEIAQHFLSQTLTHVTMQRINRKAASLHEFGQCIGAPLGSDENEALAGVLVI